MWWKTNLYSICYKSINSKFYSRTTLTVEQLLLVHKRNSFSLHVLCFSFPPNQHSRSYVSISIPLNLYWIELSANTYTLCAMCRNKFNNSRLDAVREVHVPRSRELIELDIFRKIKLEWSGEKYAWNILHKTYCSKLHF